MITSIVATVAPAKPKTTLIPGTKTTMRTTAVKRPVYLSIKIGKLHLKTDHNSEPG